VTRYVALLRAVNLGSHQKVAMPAVRELLTGIGYADVATYLQSGNAVFTATERPSEQVAAEIEDRLAGDLGLTTEVIVRTAGELRTVIDANPLEVRDPARFTVLFLYEPPAAGWLNGFQSDVFAPEEMRAGECELYLSLPNGIGRAKLPPALGRRLRVPATMRNWRTVTSLLALADG
jgi:uncharacterized protein (DUF1697 family)